MRTGEISKILSKEWNSMEAVSKIILLQQTARLNPSQSQKQFYQEQARVLKDNFNMKYPDYVYRRRPNNTRRKRKTDSSGQRLLDTTSNLSDDLRFDHPGDSPPGGEDFRASGVSDLHRTRGDHDAHTVDHPKFRQPTVRASPYPYPSLDSRPANGHDNNNYPVVGGDRMLHDVSLTPAAQYTYAPAQSHGRPHAHSTPVFHQNQVNGDGMSNWHRPASWLGAEQHDRGFHLPTPKPHRSIHSPASTSALSTPGLTLPTLSSPFFPDTATQPPLSPPNLSHSMPSSYGSSHMESPALAARDYSQHIMSQVPSNGQGYHSTGRDALIYPSPHSGGARDPSIQDFSHTPQYSAHQNSQGYWQKE
ncbi:hypothetical protein H0H93_010641 [Arthromyces matolae]|nr:hypothetical protein H0H93_010641 [Arthromyces matolae]